MRGQSACMYTEGVPVEISPENIIMPIARKQLVFVVRAG